MKLPEDGDRPLSINLVPMIDVIFSILAFFILSTLFLVPSEGLDINLPEALRTESQTQEALKVGINAQGQIRFQQQDIELENLVELVEAELTAEQTQIIIQADAEVDHGRVVAVMDQLRQIPGLQLAIATIQPE
ncbi:outer membrane transport energization protein ExbD [[Leptolyngbya] sp. PCC 7376]|uniref:ExbD/TolR family protein n=1 Tax=[Leptolyngbya] sp. PCC 7376 TaxID=111781 RepID=UPI00029F4D31|nr:biopolymer transporter ExbD [[Leptolyngbya] sp. PCC 7376]AFY38900.1 outer membrane transport energization protein ExbD [[Leptolyngbya] sp. PCC 7376]